MRRLRFRMLLFRERVRLQESLQLAYKGNSHDTRGACRRVVRALGLMRRHTAPALAVRAIMWTEHGLKERLDALVHAWANVVRASTGMLLIPHYPLCDPSAGVSAACSSR